MVEIEAPEETPAIQPTPHDSIAPSSGANMRALLIILMVSGVIYSYPANANNLPVGNAIIAGWYTMNRISPVDDKYDFTALRGDDGLQLNIGCVKGNPHFEIWRADDQPFTAGHVRVNYRIDKQAPRTETWISFGDYQEAFPIDPRAMLRRLKGASTFAIEYSIFPAGMPSALLHLDGLDQIMSVIEQDCRL
jgi:hypothetical protein